MRSVDPRSLYWLTVFAGELGSAAMVLERASNSLRAAVERDRHFVEEVLREAFTRGGIRFSSPSPQEVVRRLRALANELQLLTTALHTVLYYRTQNLGVERR